MTRIRKVSVSTFLGNNAAFLQLGKIIPQRIELLSSDGSEGVFYNNRWSSSFGYSNHRLISKHLFDDLYNALAFP